jgi:ribosome-associated toxin RatA of RatAB toxin-antitoxin module
LIELMTRIAGYVVIFGEARIEVEKSAQIHTLWRHGPFRGGHIRWQFAENGSVANTIRLPAGGYARGSAQPENP